MSFIIAEIGNLISTCEDVESKLSNLPRWRPKAKYMIAEATASCIAKLLNGYVKGIYLIDLSGGEFMADFSGRDIDLVVDIKGDLVGFENDLKQALEYALNGLLSRVAASYISEVGKRDIVEIHVVSDYRSGYGRLIKSKYSPAIRLWPPPEPW
ncbi:MAG: hypothetical protein F7C81_04745 [Desulfurococcales archaeon]|nr:hypothetical protein [Desulfurococcales archaeon]MEB3778874.1 hypothetical protein [Desulfurococcales archaeon]